MRNKKYETAREMIRETMKVTGQNARQAGETLRDAGMPIRHIDIEKTAKEEITKHFFK